MREDWQKAVGALEKRLDAIESMHSNKEDQEADELLRKIVRSIKATLWLMRGFYALAPLVGVVVAFWIWGESLTNVVQGTIRKWIDSTGN